MSEMNYLSVIDRYHEYREAIRELLSSIVTGIGDKRLCESEAALANAIQTMSEHYPFVDLIYLLDADGIQISSMVNQKGEAVDKGQEIGTDRSQRPYFKLVKQQQDVTVSEPYFSNLGRHLCITAMTGCGDSKGPYLVIDIDLREVIEFLMGDTLRGRFHPLFKSVYSLISIGLFAIVGVFLFSAFSEVASLFSGTSSSEDLYLKPFSVIIYLTLALAIFDLGKTIIEEEVLMHKDIFRHSSTRRTITRFIAAILIAVSIEALLLMFKSALSDGALLVEAVWMMFSAIGLLVGLGLYVYLGARAEALLKETYGTRNNSVGNE
ncbi:MAG: general glycosylation pathway protein [Gammaproteobacteria bacterium]|nr:general glycosylation pathway protein [Gammaproteobacteria bacterium]